MFRWHEGTLYLLVFVYIYIYIYKEGKHLLFSAEDQLGGIGPGIFLDFGPAGWSEMAFMATHLSLCGKDKYFATHKIIK